MTASQVTAEECSEFDIETALKEFLADPTCTELKLPHMTTGQRKQAKKLADQYPEIKCESYGFGQERKLHLFKQDPNCPSSPKGSSPKTEKEGDETGRSRNGSSDRSTTASGPASPEANEHQNASSRDALSPEVISVRNTFIHIEDTTPDERVVQSMPHGMFSQCWHEETMQKSKGPESAAKVAVPPPPVEAPKDVFAPGSEVVIEGLTKFPAFNGLRGTVQSLDEESGRYNVLLASHDGSAGQCAKIKGENLRMTVPPPPPFESTAQRPEEFGQQPLPGMPQEFPAMPCMGMPGLPPTPTWQDHQPLQQPVYDQGHYDPNSYAMMYPAR